MLHLINDQSTNEKGFAQLTDVLEHYADAVARTAPARVFVDS